MTQTYIYTSPALVTSSINQLNSFSNVFTTQSCNSNRVYVNGTQIINSPSIVFPTL